MTNKELLKADLLDIVFQDRNKLYGAYALRKHYNDRLAKSLAVTLSAALLAILITSFKSGENKTPSTTNVKPGVELIQVVMPEKEKPPVEEELPQPELAKADHQKIVVVPDNEADEEIVTQDLLKKSIISNITTTGIFDSSNIAKPKDDGEGTGGLKKGNPEPEKKAEHLPSYPPSFPEGQQAWIDYLRRYLQTPEELEPGQRVEVRVKFFVEIDGAVSRFEIVQSGGKEFDREVLRVMKKMPRWEPAMQNGQKIAVSFTQPVIFMGVEE